MVTLHFYQMEKDYSDVSTLFNGLNLTPDTQTITSLCVCCKGLYVITFMTNKNHIREGVNTNIIISG